MAIYRHHHYDAAELVAQLAALLQEAPADPFELELVVVPASGTQRWVSQQLSLRLGTGRGDGTDGVCAGVEFMRPDQLQQRLLVAPDEVDQWHPDQLVWPVLDAIDQSIDQPWAQLIRSYLQGPQELAGAEPVRTRMGLTEPRLGAAAVAAGGDRRYSLARKVARLWARYLQQRPALIQAWNRGEFTDGFDPLPADLLWQAHLWQLVQPAVPQPDPVTRLTQLVEQLEQDPASVALPPRLSWFGVQQLSASQRALITAVAQHRQVHLWLPTTSAMLWDAATFPEPVAQRGADSATNPFTDHLLVRSLARQEHELAAAIASWEHAHVSQPPPPAPPGPDATVLQRLQHSIRLGELTPLIEPSPPTLNPDAAAVDGSVSLHECTHPTRQVEVLRDLLAAVLEDDPQLQPRDIVIMCPDLPTYAPLLSTHFPTDPAGTHPSQQLRVEITDPTLESRNPFLEVLHAVLGLVGGRFAVTEVLQLLSLTPVKTRFGFDDEQLETITEWVQHVGIRWGVDAASRAPYGLDQFVHGTWQFGLDRLLAGAAVSDDARTWFGNVLPYDDVGSTKIDVVGRLTELVNRLASIAAACSKPRSVGQWNQLLVDALAQLTDHTWEDEWQWAQAHRVLARLGHGDQQLDVIGMRALLADHSNEFEGRVRYRSGAITVCSMAPLQLVPHPVVVLLGLDTGTVPRASIADGDDILAQAPRVGELDARLHDNQLFLNAVMAAQKRLIITYTSRDATTGAATPPAVAVAELTDTLRGLVGEAGLSQLVTEHPFHAWAPENFTARLGSFDAVAHATATAQEQDVWKPVNWGELPPAAATNVLELDKLSAFVTDPVGQFLRQRLEVALPRDEEPLATTIPIQLNGLQRWQIAERMLERALAGHSPDAVLQQAWREGQLPPGQLGWRIAEELIEEVVPIATATHELRGDQAPRSVEVDIAVGAGRRLVGSVEGIYGDTVVVSTYSWLSPKHRLEAWLQVLALTVAHPEVSWGAVVVGKHARRATFAPILPEHAPGYLADVVWLYERGMGEPLPLPLKTGAAWARSRNNPQQAASAARKEWQYNRYSPENQDPAHQLVWGKDAPLDVLLAPPDDAEVFDAETTRLGALSARLWSPIWMHQL